MENTTNFRNGVGWITILSGLVAFISYFLVAGAVQFNFDFFSDPVLIFSLPNVHIGMLRWSMIADIFGYYLLLLPALFYLHGWLLGRTPWRNLISFCGTSYILAGAMGAAILATTWTFFLLEFPLASPERQETLKLLFESFSLMVGNGIWNLFDTIVCSVWMAGMGLYMRREANFLGWFTILVGFVTFLDGVGNIIEFKMLADISLNLYLVLAPIWTILLGMAILRNKFYFSGKM